MAIVFHSVSKTYVSFPVIFEFVFFSLKISCESCSIGRIETAGMLTLIDTMCANGLYRLYHYEGKK